MTRIGLYSLSVSAFLILLICWVAGFPGCDFMWKLLLPGAFVGAIVFSTGINSSAGVGFILLAGLLDWLLFSIPVGIVMYFASERIRVARNGSK
jgi:hypothetical protein